METPVRIMVHVNIKELITLANVLKGSMAKIVKMTQDLAQWVIHA